MKKQTEGMKMAESNLTELQRDRAKFAYDYVKKVKDDNRIKHDTKDEYRQYAKKLPMMIKTNGLGATLAFVKAKSKNSRNEPTAYHYLYDDLKKWLIENDEKKLIELKDGQELVEEVINLQSAEYRAITVEVLAFLTWLSRFAEGLIEKNSKKAGQSQDGREEKTKEENA